jgi:hypothetical protein
MSYCWLLTHIQGHIFHAYVRRQQYIKNIYRNERTWATNCICHWSCPGTNNLAICWGYNVLTLFRKSKKDVFTVHGSRRTLPFYDYGEKITNTKYQFVTMDILEILENTRLCRRLIIYNYRLHLR